MAPPERHRQCGIMVPAEEEQQHQCLLMADKSCIRRSIVQGLQSTNHKIKHIPFSLLYDAKGSSLYDQILAHAPSYYLYSAELRLLLRHSAAIAASLPPHCLLLELGCGSASKSLYLLQAFLAQHAKCEYVGIDVSSAAIQEAERNIVERVGRGNGLSLSFIEGEYLPSVKRARDMFPLDKLICVLWVGSSIGNLDDEEAVTFMRHVVYILGPSTMFFLCTDLWKDDADILYKAYCDDGGYTKRFIKNGMSHALALLDYTASEEETESWEYRVTVNSQRRRVEMWVIFPAGLDVDSHNIHIRAGEGVLVEFSRKFTVANIEELAAMAGLCVQAAWRDRTYSCQMLYTVHESLLSCWRDTDAIFAGIDDWTEKPIDLRHPFVFYYGHMAALAKLKLLNSASGGAGGAENGHQFDDLFSRGMDPYVLDVSRCHAHPAASRRWPSQDAVVTYVKAVRSLLMEAVMAGAVSHRLVCFAMEHERMHQETLAYMQVQSTKARFERERKKELFRRQNGNIEGERRSRAADDYDDVVILPGTVHMGSTAMSEVFVWDNELPATERTVSEAFAVSRKAVTIRQFMAFVAGGGYESEEYWQRAEDYEYFKQKGIKCPATWTEMGGDGEYYVHGTGGDISSSKHWEEVGGEPVYVSLAEAQAYCKWAGGGKRVMTEEEYHRAMENGDREGKMVEDLTSGGWEWTSTPFAGFPGFRLMAEYPEYSADFFDGNHFVLKGCSPATHPSLVRDSFRNFYQRQYRFAFAKFRCCRSVVL